MTSRTNVGYKQKLSEILLKINMIARFLEDYYFILLPEKPSVFTENDYNYISVL